MVTHASTMNKISLIPTEMLAEINDFIDFLLSRKGITTKSYINDAEQGMSVYLDNLNEYEELLVQGKIKW